MKPIISFILFLVAMAGAQSVQLQGQRNIASQWIYFGADSSRTIYLINGQFFKDSANLGTVKKRIDNTSDSCSLPVNLTTTGTATYPIWLYKLSTGTKSNVADSNTFAFRIFVADQIYKRGGPVYMGYYAYGKNNGYADVTVQDSVIILNNKRTSKTRQYSLFASFGDRAIFCPEIIASTFKVATDTLIIDSTSIVTR